MSFLDLNGMFIHGLNINTFVLYTRINFHMSNNLKQCKSIGIKILYHRDGTQVFFMGKTHTVQN